MRMTCISILPKSLLADCYETECTFVQNNNRLQVEQEVEQRGNGYSHKLSNIKKQQVKDVMVPSLNTLD